MTKPLLLALALTVCSSAALAHPPTEAPRILQGADLTQMPAPVSPSLGTAASSDTFVFGPYDFTTGLQGWTSVDYTQNSQTYGHIVDLTTVPGSRGNAFTGGGGFTGQVAWFGVLGANACGAK